VSAWREWRFRLGAAALVLLLVSFLIPPWPAARPIYDVIAVMDITGSMNVRDQRLDDRPASRLEMEKRAARQLLAALPCGSRLGAAIFVERRPFLLFEPVEVCDNAAALDAEFQAVSWRMGWDGESHIAIGLHAAMQMANAQGADLIFMTDGQEVPPLWWTGAPDFGPLNGAEHGVIVGVGGLALAPIPKFDAMGHEVGVWHPGEVPAETAGLFRGHEHLSAVDEPHLRALARQSGLSYVHLAGADALMPALAAAVPRRTRASTIDLRFVPAALALLLLAATEWPARASGGLRLARTMWSVRRS
jgi:mxaL protein